MYYIISTFFEPVGWMGELFGLVLYDFVLAVGAVGFALLSWALFAPRWVPWLFVNAITHTFTTMVLLAITFAMSILLLLFVIPWIKGLGLL